MSDSQLFAVDDYKAIAHRMAEIAADQESDRVVMSVVRRNDVAIVDDPNGFADTMTGRLVIA